MNYATAADEIRALREENRQLRRYLRAVAAVVDEVLVEPEQDSTVPFRQADVVVDSVGDGAAAAS
jgi:hypothetical protein